MKQEYEDQNQQMNGNQGYGQNRQMNGYQGYGPNQQMNGNQGYGQNQQMNGNQGYGPNQQMNGNQGYGQNQQMNGNQGYGPNQQMNGNQGYGQNQQMNGNQGYGQNQQMNGYRQTNPYLTAQQGTNGYTNLIQMLTKKEYYKSEEMKKIRRDINTAFGCLIFSIIVTTAIMLAFTEGFYFLIDVGIMVACGIAIRFFQSRIAAFAITGYSIFNCVYSLMETGKVSGWLIVVAGIFAIKGTCSFHKAWGKYKKQYVKEDNSKVNNYA